MEMEMKSLTQALAPQPKPCPQPPPHGMFKEAQRSTKKQTAVDFNVIDRADLFVVFFTSFVKGAYAQPGSARSTLCLSRCSSQLLMRDAVCPCIGRLLIRSIVAISPYWTLTWGKAVRQCGSGSRRESFMIGSSIHVERSAYEKHMARICRERLRGLIPR